MVMNQSPVFYYSSFDTPLGLFSVAVDDGGALIAAAFGGFEDLGGRADLDGATRDEDRTAAARGQLLDYFRGGRRSFSLKTAPEGSAFQHRVWKALGEIPYGQSRSYGDIARQIGSSPRAVGRANATNPVCLVVPCHRVIGADGSLTGYAFGEDIKRRLLAHEGAGAAR